MVAIQTTAPHTQDSSKKKEIKQILTPKTERKF
jgi:hypothetical protein